MMYSVINMSGTVSLCLVVQMITDYVSQLQYLLVAVSSFENGFCYF